MKVGVVLPIGETDSIAGGSPGWREILAFAEAVKAGGLDSAWLADHLFYRSPGGPEYGLHEAWTVLAALAATTRRIELGSLVLCSSFRNPGLTAKMAATVDLIAGERFVLGVGAGWHDAEYDAFGIPRDHRVSRFEEWLEIVARLLHGERVTFQGEYHVTADAVLAPPPLRHVPILVAAEGPRMLRLAARWADAWVTAWYGYPSDGLRDKLARFGETLAAEGRDPSQVARVVGITVRDTAQPPVPEPEEGAIDGGVDDLAATLAAYADLGVDQLVVGLEPMTIRSVERLVEAARLMSRFIR